jgi:hypothetical protein
MGRRKRTDASKAEPGTPATVLNELFRTYLNPIDQREYTHKDVEEGITAIYGHKVIDASYISKLRNGIIQHPSLTSIEAICVFFDVDPLVFLPRLAQSTGRIPLIGGADKRLLGAFRRLQTSPRLFQNFTDLALNMAEQIDPTEEQENQEKPGDEESGNE